MILLLVIAAFATSFGTAAAETELTLISPQADESINGTSVMVEFEATDFSIVPSTVALEDAGNRPEANNEGEGHVHMMLDLLPVIVWESSDPYTLTDVPPGEHTLMVELVNNDHSPLSPPVVQEIRFRSTSDQMLSNTGVPRDTTPGLEVLLLMLAGTTIIAAGFVLRRKAV